MAHEDYVGENEFGQKMYKQLNGSVRIEGISGIGRTPTTYERWRQSIRYGWFKKTYSKKGMTEREAKHYAFVVFIQQGGTKKESKAIYTLLKRFVRTPPKNQDQPESVSPPKQHDVFVYVGVKDTGKSVFVSPVIVTYHNKGTAEFHWVDKKTYTDLMNTIGEGLEKAKRDNITLNFLTSITAEQQRQITGEGWNLLFYRKIRVKE